MKKFLVIITVALCITATANANSSYRISEAQLDELMQNSNEIAFEEMYSCDVSGLNANFTKSADSKTLGGYLLRCWFCGGIALHRYYMGTDNGALWALYCCIPVVGGVTQMVDFFWVIFEDDALKKYENNSKYMVWLEQK